MSAHISKSGLAEVVIDAFCGDCTQCGGHCRHDDLVEIIEHLPTLDEKEIIRKYGEQILDAFYGKHAEYRRLSEQANIELPQECYYSGHTKGFEEAIKIVKEECGISE